MAQNQHAPTISAKIASIIESCKENMQQSSKPAENSSRGHASQPIPSFSTAEAFKYMGHFTPMWVSNTNDSTTDATMTLIRLEKSSTDGRLWIGTNKPWLAFDEMIKPTIVRRRVVHATNPAKSEEERVPGYVEAPMANYSVKITRRAGDEEGEDQGRWYLTPLDEDAIGETREGWLCNVMLYIWAKANAGEVL